ncbi:MAG TPA: T9SS type A sorting domain-containing protein [Ginsengibacter sp.]
MKNLFYLLLFTFFYSIPGKSQTVDVSGACITGTITLNFLETYNGKPAYESTGTVEGFSGTQVDVYWLTPNNLWVVAFDGQPYFQNSCSGALPPSTPSTSCPWTAVMGETCTGGTSLNVTGTGTLAVKITGFTARKNDEEVVLNWQTATEINNKGFEIQRSSDGVHWNTIGFVNGNINSSIQQNYQFNDVTPLASQSFYRLAQLDIDNNITYSPIASVKFLHAGFYFIANNPGNGLYKLNIDATGNDKISFAVIDVNGRRLMSKIVNGSGTQTIDITNYSAGIYLLQIQKGNNLFTEKLIKL